MGKETEDRFYPMVKKALEEHFWNHYYDVDFEITGYPQGKNIPEKFLKDSFLREWVKRVKLPTPDIMGWVWKDFNKKEKKLVIAEFKKSPSFRDIFQVKGYAELYRSDYTLLLSREPLYDSSKQVLDFIKERPGLLKTKWRKSEIIVMFLHKTPEGIITLARLGPDIGILPDLNL